MTCHRLEDDGALADLMEAPDPHTQQCPLCSARLRGYHHIASWIAEGTTGHRAPEEWRRRTLAQLRAAVADPTPSALLRVPTAAPRPEAIPPGPAAVRVVPASAPRRTRWLAAFAIASAAIVALAVVAVMARSDEGGVTIAIGNDPPRAGSAPDVPVQTAGPDRRAHGPGTTAGRGPDEPSQRRGVTVTIDLPSQDAPTPAAATPATTPTMVDVSIDTTPSGARLFLDGALLGTTPYRGTLPRSDRRLELTISSADHVDEVITIDASRPVARHIHLIPVKHDR